MVFKTPANDDRIGNAICNQWKTFNHDTMLIDKTKYPITTEFNLNMLCENLRFHYGIDTTEEEYFNKLKELTNDNPI